MKRLLFWALVVGFAVFSIAVKNKLRVEESPIAKLKIGQPLPDFTLADMAGKNVTLSKVHPENLVIVINFWATWCGPCRMEMPSLEKLFTTRRKDGVMLLSVNEDEERAKLVDYLQKKPVTFPVLYDGGGALAKKFGVRVFPTTILVGVDGRIIGVYEGVRPYLDTEIGVILKNKPKSK